MLKIRRTAHGKAIFSLIGQFHLEQMGQLKKLFAAEPKGSLFVLDLKELTLVDREAVIFLAECEAAGIVELENCPAYVREWIKRERSEPRTPGA